MTITYSLHAYARLLREGLSDYQLLLLDATDPQPTGSKYNRRKVERCLSKIRKIHEDLNSILYANPTERPAIHSPQDAFSLLTLFLAGMDHEELWVLDLDTRNRVMKIIRLFVGSVNQSQVRISEVFRQAIMDNSPAIIIAHNHPSGDPTPSLEDVAVTRSLVEAGKLLDIEILDHLILANGRFISLKERGLGF